MISLAKEPSKNEMHNTPAQKRSTPTIGAITK